jgi:hypothetical protein
MPIIHKSILFTLRHSVLVYYIYLFIHLFVCYESVTSPRHCLISQFNYICFDILNVYKSLPGKMTTQNFDITVEVGGLFVMIPQPVTCFANARYLFAQSLAFCVVIFICYNFNSLLNRYQQRQTFNVEKGGSVVCVDWLTCGRYFFPHNLMVVCDKCGG